MNRREGLRFGVSMALVALAAVARGQGTPMVPAGSLEIVVPDVRGSAIDAVARAFAPRLAAIEGRPVAVVNRPGGNEAAGTAAVAKAAPDGATALLASGALAMNAALQPAASDVTRALTPVLLVATAPYVLAAATTLPLDSVQDVIAIAKANPGRLRYATTGRGTASHLGAEMLK